MQHKLHALTCGLRVALRRAPGCSPVAPAMTQAIALQQWPRAACAGCCMGILGWDAPCMRQVRQTLRQSCYWTRQQPRQRAHTFTSKVSHAGRGIAPLEVERLLPLELGWLFANESTWPKRHGHSTMPALKTGPWLEDTATGRVKLTHCNRHQPLTASVQDRCDKGPRPNGYGNRSRTSLVTCGSSTNMHQHKADGYWHEGR